MPVLRSFTRPSLGWIEKKLMSTLFDEHSFSSDSTLERETEREAKTWCAINAERTRNSSWFFFCVSNTIGCCCFSLEILKII
ncbi:unnamed protein product [Rotaria socialis]